MLSGTITFATNFDSGIPRLKKVLLTIGLQYETAGRGSLALYTSVCLVRSTFLCCLSSDLATDYFRHCVRVYHVSYHAFASFDHWNCDDLELGHLYYCNISSISPHF